MTIPPVGSTAQEPRLIAEEPAEGGERSTGKAIQGRSLRQIAWSRFKRDKVAMAGGVVVLLLIAMAFLAPWIVKVLGHPPNEFHQDATDPFTQGPKGAFGGMSWEFLMGVEPVNGRDIFSRIV
jgi:peptide/nickel transport system permease protein